MNNCIVPQYRPTQYLNPEKQVIYKDLFNVLLSEVFQNFNKDTNYTLNDFNNSNNINTLYNRVFGLVDNIILYNTTNDNNITAELKANIPLSFSRLSPDILEDLNIIRNNKDLFKKWHIVVSGIFKVDNVNYNEEFSDEVTNIDTDENTNKKEFDKGVNEEDAFKTINSDLKLMFSLLVSKQFKNNNVENHVNNKGLPKLAVPELIYSKLAYRINGILTEEELLEKLKDPTLRSYIPEIDQINSFVGTYSEERTDLQNIMMNQLQNLLAKPYIPIKIGKRGTITNGFISATSGIDLKIRNLWIDNFRTGNHLTNKQLKYYTDLGVLRYDPVKGYVITSKVVGIYDKIDNPVDYLKLFGIVINGANYNEYQQHKVYKIVENIEDALERFYTNQNVIDSGIDTDIASPVNELLNKFPSFSEFQIPKLRSLSPELTLLANIESQYSSIIPTLSMINIDGERQYAIANENYVSRFVNTLNKVNNISELSDSSIFAKVVNDPLFSKTFFLQVLFNEETGEKSRDIKLTNYILAGSDIHGKETSYKNMTFLQKLTNDFAQYVAEGITDIPRPETSNSFMSYGIETIDAFGKSYRPYNVINKNDFISNKVPGYLINHFIGYLHGEIERIKMSQDLSKKALLGKQYSEFTIMSFLNEDTKTKLLENINDKTVEELNKEIEDLEVGKQINDYFLERSAVLSTELTKNGTNNYSYFFRNAKLPEGFVDEAKYFNSVKLAFVTASTVNNIEFSILVSGDPSLYKENPVTGESEYHKRIKGLISTGQFWITKPSSVKIRNKSYLTERELYHRNILGIDKVNKYNELRSIVIEDVIQQSETFNKDFEASDGQGFMTLDTMYDMFIDMGIMNPYFETVFKREALIFKRDIANVPLSRHEIRTLGVLESKIAKDSDNHSITVLKMSYFGAIKNLDINGRVFDKFSLAPLFPSFVKNQPKMKKLLLDMVTNQIDYVKFKSASKGLISKVHKLSDVSTAQPDVLYQDLLKLQISTSNKVKTETAIPTQLVKLIFSNLFEEGKPKNKNIDKLYNEYLNTLSEIQRLQTEKLFGNLGITKHNGVTTIDYKKFSEMLLKEAVSRGMNNKILKSLMYNSTTKRLNGNLETVLLNDAIKLLSGYIDKTLRRYKLPGGDFVLISNSLGNELKTYSFTKNGKKGIAADVNITFSKSHRPLLNKIHPVDGNPIGTLDRLNELLLNKEWKDKHIRELTVVADRVPTQETNSMDVGIVKQFIDPIMGSVIMIPEELIVKSGTDFDFDKEKIILPSITSNGTYIERVDNIDDIIKRTNIHSWEIYHQFLEDKNPTEKIKLFQEYATNIQSINFSDRAVDFEGLYKDIVRLELAREAIVQDIARLKDVKNAESTFFNNAYPNHIYDLENDLINLSQDIEKSISDYYENLNERNKNISIAKKKIFDEMFGVKEHLKSLLELKYSDFKQQANKIVEIYSNVLLEPANKENLLKANNVERIKKIAEDTAKRTLQSVKMPIKAMIFDPIANAKVFDIFFTAKNMLSAYAKTNPFQQLLTYQNVLLNNSTTNGDIKTPLHHRFLNESEKSELINKDGNLVVGKNITLNKDSKKQDNTSQKINATVDSAKDPYFAALHIIYNNVGIDLLTVNILGYSQELATAILTHPKLIKYAQSINNGQPSYEALNTIVNKWELYKLKQETFAITRNQLHGFTLLPSYISHEIIDGEIHVTVNQKTKIKDKEKKEIIQEYNDTGIFPNNIYTSAHDVQLSDILNNGEVESLEEMQHYTEPNTVFENQPTKDKYVKSLAYEIKVVSEFLNLKSYSQKFKELNSYISFDTEKINTPFDNAKRKEQRKNVIESGIISEEELSKLDKESIVSKFNNTDTLDEIYNIFFPTISKYTKQLSELLTNYGADGKYSKGLSKSLPNNIYNDFIYSILLTHSEELQRGYAISLGIAGQENNIITRYIDIKRNPLYAQLLSNYPVLSSISTSVTNREITPKSIEPDIHVINNINMYKSSNISSSEENSIIYQFDELNKTNDYIPNPDNNPEITEYNNKVKSFINDMFLVGIVQSGLSKSHISFQEYIPEDFYNAFYNKALQTFNNKDETYKTNFINTFIDYFKYNQPKYFKSSNIAVQQFKFYNITEESMRDTNELKKAHSEIVNDLVLMMFDALDNQDMQYNINDVNFHNATTKEIESLLELEKKEVIDSDGVLPTNINLIYDEYLQKKKKESNQDIPVQKFKLDVDHISLEFKPSLNNNYTVDRNLKNKEGTKVLAATNGTTIKLNPISSKQEFIDYFTGNIDSQTSQQKKEALRQLGNYGFTIDNIMKILDSNLKIHEFLIRHEQRHIDNNDKDVYWNNGKDLMTQDKIDIEIRATIEALYQMMNPSEKESFFGIKDYSKNTLDNDYLYYGSKMSIVLDENGKAIDVLNYKSSNTKKQKILDLYNTNPDLDIQTSTYFRNKPKDEKQQQQSKTQPETTITQNDVLFTKDGVDYLMNDQQQIAFDALQKEIFGILANSETLTDSSFDDNNKVVFTSPLQKIFSNVIPRALYNNMIGLQGMGGTGKTTLVKSLIDSLNKDRKKFNKLSISYVAPTHIAVTQLQESLGMDSEGINYVDTLASKLRRTPAKTNNEFETDNNFVLKDELSYIASYKYNLPVGASDIILIDESSMISTQDIKDFITRMYTDYKQGRIRRFPIMLFLGDYHQLSPIESGNINKLGIISSLILHDDNKSQKLTQVMRSNDVELHNLYLSVADEIDAYLDAINNGKSYNMNVSNFEKLLTNDGNNLLNIRNNEHNRKNIIDDYVDYMITNNYPDGMFWLHYNNIENPFTKNALKEIRTLYFKKIGVLITNQPFQKYDYVSYHGKLSISSQHIQFNKDLISDNNELLSVLDENNYDKQNNIIITQGTFKPRSRYKILESKTILFKNKDFSFVNNSLFNNKTFFNDVNVDVHLLYNRQKKVRALFKIKDIILTKIEQKYFKNKYGKNLHIGKNYTFKNLNDNSEITYFVENAESDDFLTVLEMFNRLSDNGKPLKDNFVPTYIGSSHSYQGVGIDNTIGDASNILKYLRNDNTNVHQLDVMSSLYTTMTRTKHKLVLLSNVSSDNSNFTGFYKQEDNSEFNSDVAKSITDEFGDISKEDFKCKE